jgi:hypothetical protein
MKKLFFALCIFSLLSFNNLEKNSNTLARIEYSNNQLINLYNSIDFGLEKPDVKVFAIGIAGFQILKNKGLIQNHILTLIDFSLSSNIERMWVIDMKAGKTLFHTLVAHGRNTGEEFARYFSNEMSSYKSSLGFYLTDDLYHGKHGLSLRLDGLEKGYNDKARERAIVIHAADYVSKQFIAQHGRLGRSLGCPALPPELNADIVSTIKGKSLLFIYHPDESYLGKSPILSNVLSI